MVCIKHNIIYIITGSELRVEIQLVEKKNCSKLFKYKLIIFIKKNNDEAKIKH